MGLRPSGCGGGWGAWAAVRVGAPRARWGLDRLAAVEIVGGWGSGSLAGAVVLVQGSGGGRWR
jgi:hypothetical protein